MQSEGEKKSIYQIELDTATKVTINTIRQQQADAKVIRNCVFELINNSSRDSQSKCFTKSN